MRCTAKLHVPVFVAIIVFLASYGVANAIPSLKLIAEIPIPAAPANPAVGYNGGAAWVTNPTTGATNASFDLLSFDPNRSIMYSADRPNHAVDVIDTRTNTLLGFIPIPNNCNVGGTSCPSGVQVAPDLQKLIVTDRGTGPAGGGVYVYDLKSTPIPQAPSATFTLPNAKATDELTYDPLNHRAYVNNTTNTGDASGRYFMTVIDLNTNTVLGQIPIASGAASPEQPRFDPADHFIYTTTGGNSTVLRIDPNFVLDPNNPANNTGAILATFSYPGCAPAGIDMNPADNNALIGCNPGAPNGAGQELINLTSGALLHTYPTITATDVLAFDPSINEWFTASQNLVFANGCPAATNNSAQFPQVGIFSDTAGFPVSSVCSGQGSHGLGVDPLHNEVYVPTALFPASGPAGTNFFTGGILVFQTVPEPGSFLLLGFGLLAFLAIHRRSVNS